MANPIVTIEMESGAVMSGELYPEIAPNTVNNFIALANSGFYDGVVFHRVIPGFMIQGGDPDGNGTGGPGYEIKGEFSANGFKNDLKHTLGVLSMARTMIPDRAGSQFFIMVADAPHLDGQYAAFGKITENAQAAVDISRVNRNMYNDMPKKPQVIKTIRESYDNAKERLMERFNLSEIQAQVVLDMQLKRLQGLEREKLEAEYAELEKRIEYYRELLSNEEMLKGVLKDELTAIRDKYGDDRLTEIQDVEDEIDIEDLIEEEQCVFTLSHAGYCKRVPASTYRSQKRGGRGVTGMTTKEEDFVEGVFTASTHDYILFFTNLGKVHRRKGYQIPEAGRTAKGTNLVNILPFEPGEKVTAGITVHEFDEDYLVFVTRNGTVKRLELASLNTARKAGIRALTLSEGDELIAVMKTDGKQDILLASANGMVICFNENDVRVMGRDAAGVRGMMLDAGDYVVGAGIAAKAKQLLSVTEYGYGKRTEIEAYLRLGEDGQRRPQNRGGKGLKGYNITAKTGRIAGVAIVDDADDIMLIENGGVLIRMAAADINIYGRDTQGVILMRLEAGSRVISVDRVDREPEEPAENQNPEPEISTPDGNDFV